MTRVLVPVQILEGETVSAGLCHLLAPTAVTVLGYHILPEQTPPEQAEAQFEERANSALRDLVEEFEAAGASADSRLAFTHDKEQTITRVANEVGAHVRVVPGAVGDIDQLLVPVTGTVAIDRIMDVVETLVEGREIGVTVFAAGEETETGERLETARKRLEAAGVDVTTRTARGDPFPSLLDAIPGHDAIVMGGQAPSLSSLLFGEETERVAEASVGPVLVVRAPPSSDEESTAGEASDPEAPE